MTSGWIRLARSKSASSEIIGVLVTPPGTKTLTVTPVPSRSNRRDIAWFGDPRFTAVGAALS
jgi:hypothetical protein